MPARGASTTRFGIVIPPSSQGSCRLRIGVKASRGGSGRTTSWTPPRHGSVLIALPDQPQALEREQRVDVVDVLAEGDDRSRQAAGGDGLDVVAQLVAQPRDHAVDLGGEA